MACALTTVGKFRALSPSSDALDDTAILAAIMAASTSAQRYCGREFASSSQTEYYDGNGYPNLPLNKWPITAVSSVYVDVSGGYGQLANTFGSSTQLTATQYCYQAAQGFLQLVAPGGWWPFGWGPGYSAWGYPGLTRRGATWPGWPKVAGCIKVTYTAGYTDIPEDIQVAVCAMSAYILLATDTGGLINTSTSYIDTSIGSGFLSENLARGNVPALGSARAILDSYRDQKLNRGCF